MSRRIDLPQDPFLAYKTTRVTRQAFLQEQEALTEFSQAQEGKGYYLVTTYYCPNPPMPGNAPCRSCHCCQWHGHTINGPWSAKYLKTKRCLVCQLVGNTVATTTIFWGRISLHPPTPLSGANDKYYCTTAITILCGTHTQTYMSHESRKVLDEHFYLEEFDEWQPH